MDSEILNLCLSLSKNVKNGDINSSLEDIQYLAKLKPLIKIIPNNLIPIEKKWNLEYCDLVKIKIEDSTGETEIDYNINNYATVGELKEKVRIIILKRVNL